MMAKLGIHIVITGYRYNVKSVIDSINDLKCTHIMMVPAITIDIMNYVEKNGLKLNTLKSKVIYKTFIFKSLLTLFLLSFLNTHDNKTKSDVITGSAPTTVETVRQFLQNAPEVKHFLIRYGSTETGKLA